MGSRRGAILTENLFHVLLFAAMLQSIFLDNMKVCLVILVSATIIELSFSLIMVIKSDLILQLRKKYRAKMQLQRDLGVMTIFRQIVL